MIKDFEFKTFLTPTDPEHSKPTGGLGVLYNKNFKIVKIQPNTEQFINLQNGGRVQLTAIILPNDVVIFLVNIYCWTNGHTNTLAADRSDDLMHIVLLELQSQPQGHRIIAGDLNADVCDLPSLQSVIDDGSFIDVATFFP
eukprot:7117758-Karenia_brevis.AAC.1